MPNDKETQIQLTTGRRQQLIHYDMVRNSYRFFLRYTMVSSV